MAFTTYNKSDVVEYLESYGIWTAARVVEDDGSPNVKLSFPKFGKRYTSLYPKDKVRAMVEERALSKNLRMRLRKWIKGDIIHYTHLGKTKSGLIEVNDHRAGKFLLKNRISVPYEEVSHLVEHKENVGPSAKKSKSEPVTGISRNTDEMLHEYSRQEDLSDVSEPAVAEKAKLFSTLNELNEGMHFSSAIISALEGIKKTISEADRNICSSLQLLNTDLMLEISEGGFNRNPKKKNQANHKKIGRSRYPIPQEPVHIMSEEQVHAMSKEPLHIMSEDPEHGTSEEPEHGTSEEPEHAMSEDLEHGVSEEPEHGTSEDSEHGMSEEPEYAMFQDPEHGTSKEPEHGTSEELEHAMSEDPEHGMSEEPEHAMSEEPKHVKLEVLEYAISEEPEHTTSVDLEHATSEEPGNPMSPILEKQAYLIPEKPGDSSEPFIRTLPSKTGQSAQYPLPTAVIKILKMMTKDRLSFARLVFCQLFTVEEMRNRSCPGYLKNLGQKANPLDPNKLEYIKELVNEIYPPTPGNAEKEWNMLRNRFNRMIKYYTKEKFKNQNEKMSPCS